jgi:flagellum-specific peptidoglycan hydrolase FlgJ
MVQCTKFLLKWCGAMHIVHCNIFGGNLMADETKVEAQGAAEAPAKVAEAVAETAETVAKESAKTAKRTRAATARRAKREGAPPKPPRRARPRRARQDRAARPVPPPARLPRGQAKDQDRDQQQFLQGLRRRSGVRAVPVDVRRRQ